MRYTLLVVWITGERETYTYSTRKDAEQGAGNFYRAFGGQIAYTGIMEG